MKVRRYKGPSREDLYKAIQKEMGPNAIVVTPESSGSGFGRPRQYELIAILEEPPTDSPAERIEAPGRTEEPEGLRRMQRMQSRQWAEMQKTLEKMQESINLLKTEGGEAEDGPAYSRAWDPRFCQWVQSECPGLLDGDADEARRRLAERLDATSEFSFRTSGSGPHVVALVGPTGSGKTTTLAKLAAICSMQKKMKVALLTIDTYRVAAVDQIREYASLLDVDLRVLFSADEAKQAVQDLQENDVIFVDTPGRAPFDGMGLAGVRKVMRGLGDYTALLTLPATTSRSDLPGLIDGFSLFSPDHLVVTKVDESRHSEVLSTFPFETDLRVAFIANGQQVPQDICAADSARLANLLIAEPGSDMECAVAETKEVVS